MVARPLVAEGGDGHDDMTKRQTRNENARAAGDHEASRTEPDQFIKPCSGEWRTDAPERDAESCAGPLDFEYRVPTHL